MDLVITTHNSGCTALYLNYTGITRLTDVLPYKIGYGFPHAPDEYYYGINITAVIWASDLNMTIQSVVKRPDVSSVAAYSHTTSNPTETPELLAQLHDPDIVVRGLSLTEYGGLRQSDISLLMNGMGWNGADPGTGPASIKTHENDYDDIVDLVITTHNSGCTALYLNYTGITRLTDVLPYKIGYGFPHAPDEYYYGINVTTIIWASDLNMTIQSVVKRPDVSSVAAYSHTTSNPTETPELLALIRDPDVVRNFFGYPTVCGGLREADIPMLMNDIGWNSADPGTGPVGSKQGTIESSSSADSAVSDEPVKLTLDPWPETRVDLDTYIVYAGDLMGVGISTTDYLSIWAYIKENGALVRSAEPGMVIGYIPHSLFGPLSIWDDVRFLDKMLKDYSRLEYGTTN